MKTKKVTKWLQNGYPHLKKESGLPTWVVPEHSFARITEEVGDESILEMYKPLGLADVIEELLETAPDPGTVPPEMWQTAIKLWPPHSQVRPVVSVSLETSDRVLRQFQSGELKGDPVVVCRGLAVISCAPFIPRGKRITEELASIVGGDANKPAELVKKYMDGVSRGDAALMERVDGCIRKHRRWMEWAGKVLQLMRDMPYTPKPIGVTPSPSAELIGVLCWMIKEGQDDESGRDHS